MLVQENDELIDVLNRGQGVLNLLALDGVVEGSTPPSSSCSPARGTPARGADAGDAGEAPAKPPASLRRTGSSRS